MVKIQKSKIFDSSTLTRLKILAIGDFHGRFHGKFDKIIRKEKIDLILTNGDFCGNKELGKLFFKYAYGSDKELWEFIGKKRFNDLEKRNFNSGINVLRKLNSFNIPVIGVKGNWDPVEWGEIGHPEMKDLVAARKFNKILKDLKNIRIIDFKNYNRFGINFVGYPRSSYPGFLSKKKVIKLIKQNGNDARVEIKRINEDNKKYFKLFNRLFDENTIFITHNCPYNSKLDKIKKGPQKGKHYGSWLARKVTYELNPRIVICGHMHENKGIQKIGKSIVLNPGAAIEGKAAIIDYPANRRGKIEVRFIR